MPPSHHSSSSHSSHSSHSSSSRSSSSRSSYSSSSRSSYSGSSRSSSSRGPSGHSSSSRTSRPVGGSSFSRGAGAPPPGRPRVNQPTGYYGQQPRRVYGRRHDYIYYPTPWVDSTTGTRFEKGYYDENGNRYDDVAFRKNGTYENVLCHCPYCGQDAVMNLNAQDVGVKPLQCPNCGGPLEIRSELDDVVQDAYDPAEASRQAPAGRPRKKRGCLISALIVLVILTVLDLYGSYLLKTQPSPEPVQQFTGDQLLLHDYNRDRPLRIVRTGENSFRPAESGESPDKSLAWDSDYESFYDPDSDCWIWYNTDVQPPVWQYWYEGISSDYGDYGWMEHDETGWYIEADYGDWIELPGKYDSSALWYFD